MRLLHLILTLGCTPKPLDLDRSLPAVAPNTHIPASSLPDYSDALPVHIDIDWYGRTMTLPNGGLVNRGHVVEPNHLSL